MRNKHYSKNKYCKDFPKIRLIVLNSDNYKCQKCNKDGNTVHHIDYNPQNNKRNNLITLCMRCNIIVNTNRDYWYAYFTYIKENK